MAELPYSISIPSWRTIFVHAGIVPTEGLAAQTAGNLVTMRNVVDEEDSDGSTTVRGTSKIDEGVAWVSRWDGRLVNAKDIVGSDNDELATGWHVIFGHDARRGLQQTPYATGLDTGCSYGMMNARASSLNVRLIIVRSFDRKAIDGGDSAGETTSASASQGRIQSSGGQRLSLVFAFGHVDHAAMTCSSAVCCIPLSAVCRLSIRAGSVFRCVHKWDTNSIDL